MRTFFALFLAFLALSAISCSNPVGTSPQQSPPIITPEPPTEPEKPIPPLPAPPYGSKILRETAEFAWYVHEGAVSRMDLSTGATVTLSENPKTYTPNSAADRRDFDYAGIGVWSNNTRLHVIGGNIYLTDTYNYQTRAVALTPAGPIGFGNQRDIELLHALTDTTPDYPTSDYTFQQAGKIYRFTSGDYWNAPYESTYTLILYELAVNPPAARVLTLTELDVWEAAPVPWTSEAQFTFAVNSDQSIQAWGKRFAVSGGKIAEVK